MRSPALIAGTRALAPVNRALLGVLMLHLVAAAPAAAQAAPPAPQFPLLGVDPIASGTVLENHADALLHWVQRGYQSAVLLHIDAQDDLRAVAEETVTTLKSLQGRGDTAELLAAGRTGKDALYGENDFVRAAALLGIVREVVWVVPFPLPRDDGAGGRLKDYLGQAGFDARDVGTFREEGGCYRGTVGTLPVALCAQEQLPAVAEPVLLSIDADYLLHAARYRGVTVLTGIRALLGALREARYAVRDATVAHSVQSGAVPVELRWAGEAVVEALRDPSIVRQQDPPERWNALQRLVLLKAAGREKEGELLNVALSLLERQPHDPALLYFAAAAAAGHGGGAAALAYAEQACRVERGYCVGLREVGLQLLALGAVEDAMPFFAAADRLLPGMTHGLLDAGILLANAGRLAEAVAAFERLIEREGAFPAAFLVGTIHVASGDRPAARRSYDAGLAALAQSPRPIVTREETAGAIRGAAAFYREEGLLSQAEQLERDAGLKSAGGGGP